jgi:prevent-host-death family protein
VENPLKVSLENIIPLTEARDHFSQIVNEVQKDKLYVLTKGGKPAVAIVDVKYLEHITGGGAKIEHVQEEIRKAPEKVGLPPMVEHKTQPTTPSAPPITPSTPPVAPPITRPTPPPVQQQGVTIQPPKPATPSTPPPTPPKTEQPKPAPAGFAAPQQPQNTNAVSTQTTAVNVAKPQAAPTPATPPPAGGEKIDVQISQEPPAGDKTPVKSSLLSSPDDEASPAQYKGDTGTEEPEDMSID